MSNPHSLPRHGESGFTLVAFMVLIAIMSIVMGVAVQTVSFHAQREREAELIFRGEQYVEAIRLYKMKFGRYPVKLKELWESDPRVIRHEWKDPMTDSHQWALVFEGQQGGQMIGGRSGQMPVNRLPGGENQPRPTGTPGVGDPDQMGGGRGNPSSFVVSGEDGELPPAGAGQRARIGPIVGVHSTSCEESIKVYEGRTTYCEWRFVFKDKQQQGNRRGRVPPRTTPRTTPTARR